MRLPEDLSKYDPQYRDDGSQGGGWRAVVAVATSIGFLASIIWLAILLLR